MLKIFTNTHTHTKNGLYKILTKRSWFSNFGIIQVIKTNELTALVRKTQTMSFSEDKFRHKITGDKPMYYKREGMNCRKKIGANFQMNIESNFFKCFKTIFTFIFIHILYIYFCLIE